jgi:GntR family transcriptional regulator
LHSQIRDQLRRQIFDGSYLQHDKLPSETQLMTQFGVSRITVRHALGALEQEGLVFKIAGKGCYVAKPKPTQELGRLQGFAEAMSLSGHESYNRVVAIRTLSASLEVCNAFALPAATTMTEIRRVRYLDRTPISFDLTYVTQALGLRLAREDLATRDIFQILENDFAIALGHADLGIDATVADATLAQQLEVAVGAPLLYLERMTYTREGEPLELDYIHYRGDRFRYQLRIDRA